MYVELTRKQRVLLNSIVIYNPENIGAFFTAFLKEIVTDILVNYIDKEMYEEDLMNIKDKIRFRIHDEKLNDVYVSNITAYFYMPFYLVTRISINYLRLSIMLHYENLDIYYNWGNF